MGYLIEDRRKFIPALNQSWLTPLYDPILRYVMREEVFKQRLTLLANPRPRERVLDLGCGTGTLTMMIKRRQPAADVSALDADERVLEIGRQKAIKAGLPDIHWEQGFSDELPYPGDSFDLVVSSLVIHHLVPSSRYQTFQEIFRILRPGGRLFILDFGPPQDKLMCLISGLMARFEQTKDLFQGQIPLLLIKAGFAKVEEREVFRSAFGPLSLIQAVRTDTSPDGQHSS